MKTFFRNNGLSIVFFILFVLSLGGQTFTGLTEHNDEIQDMGGTAINLSQYLWSGHFLQSTFENWESEFLQMALFLILSIFLYQKGSSESKDPDKEEDVDREPNLVQQNQYSWVGKFDYSADVSMGIPSTNSGVLGTVCLTATRTLANDLLNVVCDPNMSWLERIIQIPGFFSTFRRFIARCFKPSRLCNVNTIRCSPLKHL